MKRYISFLLALTINGLSVFFSVNFEKSFTPYIWISLFFCIILFLWCMYEVYKDRGVTHIPILLSILVLCALLTFFEVPNFILITMAYTFVLFLYFITFNKKESIQREETIQK